MSNSQNDSSENDNLIESENDNGSQNDNGSPNKILDNKYFIMIIVVVGIILFGVIFIYPHISFFKPKAKFETVIEPKTRFVSDNVLLGGSKILDIFKQPAFIILLFFIIYGFLQELSRSETSWQNSVDNRYDVNNNIRNSN